MLILTSQMLGSMPPSSCPGTKRHLHNRSCELWHDWHVLLNMDGKWEEGVASEENVRAVRLCRVMKSLKWPQPVS